MNIIQTYSLIKSKLTELIPYTTFYGRPDDWGQLINKVDFPIVIVDYPFDLSFVNGVLQPITLTLRVINLSRQSDICPADVELLASSQRVIDSLVVYMTDSIDITHT